MVSATMDHTRWSGYLPMQDHVKYKVVDRRKFTAIMLLILSAFSVGVWVSLDRIAEYANHLEQLILTKPARGAQTLTEVMQMVAILSGIVLSSFASLVIWHGWRGWRTASMPPAGSWILEGQRTWTGESAKRIAKFTIIVGVLLTVLAAASSLTLWNMGETLIDETLKQSPNQGGLPTLFSARASDPFAAIDHA